MKASFLERRHFLVFVVLVGLGLAVTTVAVKSPERVSPLEAAALRVIGPLAGAGGKVSELSDDLWTGLGSVRRATHELAAARVENRDLRVLVADRRELAAENERLRRLLSLTASVPHRSVPARIVHREQRPDHVLIVDRGSRDGIADDQPVISPEGVVGKVLSVTPGQAKVQCIDDPDAGIAVLVGEGRRQVDAIVTESGGGVVRLRHFEQFADVQPGDLVVTSGLDQIHPKGLLVGTVVEVGGDEVDREILVRPAVDFGRLEEVLVLVPDVPPAKPEGGA